MSNTGGWIDLTDEQMDDIAERAARKAIDMVYMEVGKSVLRKVAWITGVVVISLMLYLAGKGAIITRGQ